MKIAEQQDAFDLVVVEVSDASDSVRSLVLARADGADLPAWKPGAHLTLHLPEGLERHYSLCGDAREPDHYRIAVLNQPEGRGGSRWIFDHARPGLELSVQAPRNHFALVNAPAYLFVAGGIGITPILPMIAQVSATGVPWTLAYGGRTLSSMAFVADLQAHGDAVSIRPQDEYGLLDLASLIETALPGSAVYCCGPEAMIEAVETLTAGRVDRSLHVERFKAREQMSQIDEAFDVVLSRLNVTLRVEPGKSIVQTLESAGIDVLTSCREGICGTCETDVLAGAIDHRDSYLTPEERESGETMMICCSRAAGASLTLDL